MSTSIPHKIQRSMKFVFLLTLLTPLLTHAQSSVWKISKGDHHLFIGGTIHVLSKNDYPLPASYDKAYQLASRIVLETDINKANNPDFQLKMVEQFIYKDGSNLQSALLPTTFTTLSNYCKNAGIPLAQLMPFKPQFATLMLTIFELKNLGIDLAGVDDHFNKRARIDGKPIDQLETIEEQLQFLVHMGRGQEDELILSTIKENLKLAEIMQLILTSWRSGNNVKLDQEIIKPMQKEFPDIHRDILVKRNNKWLPLINNYLATPEVEFILVGTLHLAGEHGLIKQLKDHGLTITQW